jgi:hypothetical protein
VQHGVNLHFLRNMLVKLITSDDRKAVFPIISDLFGLSPAERDLCSSKLLPTPARKSSH